MSAPEVTNPEDLKIITLARSSRARAGALQGAAVRDTDGRTYAAATVALPHLSLSAVTVAVAMAVSSGAAGLEAVAVVGDLPLTDEERTVIGDVAGADVAVWSADPTGTVRELVTL